ncbi:MAG TPA: hypothetical protein PLA43_12115 [Bryobacteraceae bacterium]|nr:hypothetical protein [Bryobacteraceae bacterium]HPU72695.1 hypothetical protein [Bryobacteraceae bacterium]
MLVSDNKQWQEGETSEVPIEERREAVRRVAASSVLKKSARLRELLNYLADRSLEDDQACVPEQEIGIAVFGRKDYGAREDNLVRVHAANLRKKLEEYFATEGAGDPVVFEIPRGSYALRFRYRRKEPCPALGGARRRWPALARQAAIVTVLMAVAAAAGWWARGSWRVGTAPPPMVRKLWTQFFGNGLPCEIVLADANHTAFQDFIKTTLPLRQYGRPVLNRQFVEERYSDPEVQRLIIRLAGRYFVAFSDAAAAREIEALGLAPDIRFRYEFARTYTAERLMEGNAVLLGNKRANPWVELFEQHLRFRYAFDDESTMSRFEDTQPAPGQPAVYPTVWERASHCQVAMLPNLRQTGSVLIISGGDQQAAVAGAEFITNERWVTDLANLLGVSRDGRFPYFEVLLKTSTVASTAPEFSILFCRRVDIK